MALFKRKTAGKPGEWYYCLHHETVEEGPQCAGRNRLGPYGTPAEAGRAIDSVHARNDEWDNDPRWNDDRSRGGADGSGGSEGSGGSGGGAGRG